jgi:hypothetical protein
MSEEINEEWISDKIPLRVGRPRRASVSTGRMCARNGALAAGDVADEALEAVKAEFARKLRADQIWR